MKIKFLITGICLISAASVFAQKGELSNAQDEYNSFSALRGQKTGALADKATTSLNNAKVSIDKASANAKTANLPATYAVKGAVYASLALRDTAASTSTPLFATAEDALKKAKELDTKGENKKLIDDAYSELIQYKFNFGVKAYQGAKYDLAYDDFNFFKTQRPDDTTALYLTGLSAAAAKQYDNAIDSYTKLTTKTYSKKPEVYSDLAYVYLQKHDTTNAIKVVTEGADKYPLDPKLTKREIELNLQVGQQAKVLEKLEKAIANDPKNKALYYYGGLAYSQTKDYAKAEAMYRKAIEIDPDYFDANLNLGALLLQPGNQLYNTAQKLDVKKQKEYDDDMAKATTYFETAKPVIMKAVELNPNSYEALYNLKVYYLGTRNMAQATATQKKMDAIK